jgi:TonB-dependent receptor
VNLITRSALDREGQFMSLDVGYGKYEVSEEWSHKLSAVYGNVWGGEKVKFGMQVTYNQSMDRRGSDTVRIGDWHARVNVGLINALDGFRANTLYLEDYLIARERQGVSTKLELRVNNKHTFELSASLNRFDDDEVRQTYNYNAANGQQHYYGARYMTVTIARTLGYDPNDPAVWARITASNTDDRRLTFEEALKIDLGYDYDRKIFTKSIFDSDSQYRQWLSGLVKDEITTFQFGGTHNFTDNFSLNYKVHSSEASKETHQQLTRFAAGQGTEVSMELVGDRMVFYHRGGRTVFNPSVFGLGQGAGLIQDNMIYSDDERSGGELNAIYKWTTGRLSHQTEIGGYYDQREKSYWRNFNQYSDLIVSGRTVPRLYMSDPQFYGGVLEGFLEEYGMDYEFGPMVNTATARLFIDNPADYKVVFLKVRNDITSTVSDALLRDYSATEDIKSGYLMHSMDIGNLKLIGGVRFERTENTFTNNLILTRNPDLPGNLGRTFLHPGLWENMFKSIGPEAFTVPMTSERSYDHVLPALHAIYRVSDKLVVRAAVTQTLARPDYTDLVPREIPGISGAAYSTSITMPNFELMPLESVNYDLSADYYFKGFGYLYVGLFYKDLDGPIYTEHVAHDLGTETYAYLTNKYVSNPAQFAGTWSTRRRVNAGKGELYGLEFAYEQKFSRLPGPLSGLGMSMNFALMESSVHLPTTFTPIKDAKPLDRSGEKLPLFLQPDKLANLSVFWEKYGLLVRASLLYKGKYINDTAVSGSSVEELAAVGLPLNSYDVYVGDFLRLDLLVRYRLTRSLSIYFEGTNLNNEPIYHYYGEEWRMNMLRHTRPVYFVGMRWSY